MDPLKSGAIFRVKDIGVLRSPTMQSNSKPKPKPISGESQRSTSGDGIAADKKDNNRNEKEGDYASSGGGVSKNADPAAVFVKERFDHIFRSTAMPHAETLINTGMNMFPGASSSSSSYNIPPSSSNNRQYSSPSHRSPQSHPQAYRSSPSRSQSSQRAPVYARTPSPNHARGGGYSGDRSGRSDPRARDRDKERDRDRDRRGSREGEQGQRGHTPTRGTERERTRPSPSPGPINNQRSSNSYSNSPRVAADLASASESVSVSVPAAPILAPVPIAVRSNASNSKNNATNIITDGTTGTTDGIDGTNTNKPYEPKTVSVVVAVPTKAVSDGPVSGQKQSRGARMASARGDSLASLSMSVSSANSQTNSQTNSHGNQGDGNQDNRNSQGSYNNDGTDNGSLNSGASVSVERNYSQSPIGLDVMLEGQYEQRQRDSQKGVSQREVNTDNSHNSHNAHNTHNTHNNAENNDTANYNYRDSEYYNDPYPDRRSSYNEGQGVYDGEGDNRYGANGVGGDERGYYSYDDADDRDRDRERGGGRGEGGGRDRDRDRRTGGRRGKRGGRDTHADNDYYPDYLDNDYPYDHMGQDLDHNQGDIIGGGRGSPSLKMVPMKGKGRNNKDKDKASSESKLRSSGSWANTRLSAEGPPPSMEFNCTSCNKYVGRTWRGLNMHRMKCEPYQTSVGGKVMGYAVKKGAGSRGGPGSRAKIRAIREGRDWGGSPTDERDESESTAVKRPRRKKRTGTLKGDIDKMEEGTYNINYSTGEEAGDEDETDAGDVELSNGEDLQSMEQRGMRKKRRVSGTSRKIAVGKKKKKSSVYDMDADDVEGGDFDEGWEGEEGEYTPRRGKRQRVKTNRLGHSSEEEGSDYSEEENRNRNRNGNGNGNGKRSSANAAANSNSADGVALDGDMSMAVVEMQQQTIAGAEGELSQFSQGKWSPLEVVALYAAHAAVLKETEGEDCDSMSDAEFWGSVSDSLQSPSGQTRIPVRRTAQDCRLKWESAAKETDARRKRNANANNGAGTGTGGEREGEGVVVDI